MTAAPAWGLAAAAGALCVLGFAPFAVPAVPLLALAMLFVLWSDASPRRAAQCGFAFGAGLFGAGASWIYVALTAFGDMPPWLGAISIAGFCAYLALWPALAGWIAARATVPRSVGRLVACAGAWTAAEWLRGTVFSGFNWLSVGYAEVPGGLLAGYAPVGGLFVVSLAVALVAALRGARDRGDRARRAARPRARLARARRSARDGRQRRARPGRVDAAGRRAAGGVARAGQRAAGGEVRPGAARSHVRALHGARRAEPRPARRAAGERVPDVREPRARGGARRARRPGACAQRPAAARPLHRRPAAARRAGAALLQHRRRARRRRRRPAVSQAAPRAVRRVDPAEDADRPADQRHPRDPAVRPDAGRGRPAAVRGGRPPHRGQHLLRGRVRRAS